MFSAIAIVAMGHPLIRRRNGEKLSQAQTLFYRYGPFKPRIVGPAAYGSSRSRSSSRAVARQTQVSEAP